MSASSPVPASEARGRGVAFTAVTVIMALVVGLTFLFGFGNVVRHDVAQSEWTHRVRDRRCPVV
jgi:hypothetical protein